MSLPIYIVDEVGRFVTATSAKLLTYLQTIDPNITGIQYYYGHYTEIIETLMQRDGADNIYNKYPAVCLFMDFAEDNGQPGISSFDRLNILICTSTEQDYKVQAERYDVNFKPILYPIYYEFLEQIAKSGVVMVQNVINIKHTKIDRPFWGRTATYKNEKNIFNDRVDAIEILNLQLKFYTQTCVST